MKIIRSLKAMLEFSKKNALRNKTIGFIPTMGALHLGHLSLIEQARKENDIVVVSIFVNPAQFAPNEDFKEYPRKLRQDALHCKKAGADIVFCPGSKAMFPDNYRTYVTVEGLSDCLCGEFRPGHFRGVATVVAKLFNIVQPKNAYFGQKDAQQSIIINKMVEDLNMAVNVKVLPTIREKDGLAMSSRNAYLSAAERKDALVLSSALRLASSLVRSGVRDARAVTQNVRRIISENKSAHIDYVAIVNADTLEPIKTIMGKCLVVLAVWIGKTRLIDNITVKAKVKSQK